MAGRKSVRWVVGCRTLLLLVLGIQCVCMGVSTVVWVLPSRTVVGLGPGNPTAKATARRPTAVDCKPNESDISFLLKLHIQVLAYRRCIDLRLWLAFLINGWRLQSTRTGMKSVMC